MISVILWIIFVWTKSQINAAIKQLIFFSSKLFRFFFASLVKWSIWNEVNRMNLCLWAPHKKSATALLTDLRRKFELRHFFQRLKNCYRIIAALSLIMDQHEEEEEKKMLEMNHIGSVISQHYWQFKCTKTK